MKRTVKKLSRSEQRRNLEQINTNDRHAMRDYVDKYGVPEHSLLDEEDGMRIGREVEEANGRIRNDDESGTMTEDYITS